MAAVSLVRRRRSTQQAALLNTNLPIMSGFVTAMLPSIYKNLNIGGGNFGAFGLLSGTVNFASNCYGLGVTGAATGCIAGPGPGTGQFTVLVVATAGPSIGGTNDEFIHIGGTMWFGANAGGLIISDATTDLSVGTLASNEKVIAATTFDGTTYAGYKNGILGGSRTTGLPSATGQTVVLARSNTNFPWTGVVNLVLVWNRALSATEIRSISANPWQVFQAPRAFTANLQLANLSVNQTAGSTTQTATLANVISLGTNRTDLSTTQNATLANVDKLNATHTDLGTSQSVTIANVESLNASHTDLSTTQVATISTATGVNASHTDLGTSQSVTIAEVIALSGSHTDLGTSQSVTIAEVIALSGSHTDLGTSQSVAIGAVESLSVTRTDLGTSQSAAAIHLSTLNASHTDLPTTQYASIGYKTIAVNQLADATSQNARLAVGLGYAPSNAEVFVAPELRWVIVPS
jgi:predicted anti-sigma-YlaC factor YlaD